MDSFNSNDWSSTPPVENHDMGYGGIPTSRPQGTDLPLEQIQLRRADQPMDPTSGVFQQAFEYVKQRPAETLIMSVLSLIFNSGGGSGGGGGGDSSSSSSGSYDGYDYSGGSDFDYGTWFDGSDLMGMIGPDAIFSGSSPLVASMGGGEAAVLAVIAFVVLAVVLVMAVIGVFVTYGSTSMWLRIIRNQPMDLGMSFKGSVAMFLPLACTMFFVFLAKLTGLMLCIVPGVILALGFYFTSFMVVDKNIPYVDALKASWELTDGHKVSLFVFAILAFLLNFAGVLACCVGVVVTNAVVMGATAIIYDRLAAPGNSYLQEGDGVSAVFE